ncbi:hypothetical protein COLO4_20593 [Corchorus olitorius]|uniref:Uncharacterized protein n=1 Tax=Corchorus olitorius TaxID=93759 RepID=A0A1R3IYT9_9ROSI|nr:hypothetical protein COLO4_20593 [Corchorus olitorius]
MEEMSVEDGASGGDELSREKKNPEPILQGEGLSREDLGEREFQPGHKMESACVYLSNADKLRRLLSWPW